MNEKEQKAFDALPKPPEGSAFTLARVSTHFDPHPYCITPKHLEYADSMYLNEESIARAESKGAKCGVSGCHLPMAEHKSFLVAMVEVPRGTNTGPALQALPGLHAYLLSAKEAAEKAGIEGFGFPEKKS